MRVGPTAATAEHSHLQWLQLLIVSVGTFVTTFNATASLSTIVPSISGWFAADVSTVAWVLTVFQVVSAGLVLAFGRLGDLRGHRKVYIVGHTVLVLGAVVTASAPSLMIMAIGRLIQGVGAAMSFASTTALVSLAFSGRGRGQALGLQLTVATVGMAAGPIVAGWFADQYDWRWVFWANVPVGVFTVALAWWGLPQSRTSSGAGFDLPGAATFTAALVALMVVIGQGSTWGWGSQASIALSVGALGLFVLFFRIERRSPSPMLDLKLISSTSLSGPVAAAFTSYVGLSSLLLLVPLYLVEVRGSSAAEAGLWLAMLTGVRSILGPLSGTLSDKLGPGSISAVGLVFQATSLATLAFIQPHSSPVHLAAVLILGGIGLGLFLAPNTSAVMDAAPQHQQGTAAGLVTIARNIGLSCGAVFAGALVSAAAGKTTADAVVEILPVAGVGGCVLVLAGSLLAGVAQRR